MSHPGMLEVPMPTSKDVYSVELAPMLCIGCFYKSDGWSGQFSVAWVGFGFGKFPLKIPNFFLSDKKISSGRVKKYPGQRRVSFLFTASQIYANICQGPSLFYTEDASSILKIFISYFSVSCLYLLGNN